MTVALGTTLISAVPSFAGAAAAATAAGSASAKGFSGAFNSESSGSIADAFKTVWGAIPEGFTKPGGEAGKAFAEAFAAAASGSQEEVVSSFMGAFDGVEGAVQKLVTNIPLVGTAFNALQPTFDNFKEAGLGVITTFTEIGDTYIEAARKIAGQTLDTSQLEGLLDDVREITASGAIVHFDDVANSIGRINSSIQGLDPGQLKEVTTTFAEGIELVGNMDVTKVAGVMQAWSIGAEDTNDELTKLVNTSRNYGEAMPRLLDQMTQTGPSMRQFGFSLDETATFFARMTQMGEPAARSVNTMSHAVDVFTAAGKDPVEGMKELVAATKQFLADGDQAGATKLLEGYFTSRGAPTMLEAIKDGYLTAADAMTTVAGIGDPLGKGVEETKSLGDAFEVVGAQVQASLAPVGEYMAKGLSEAMGKVTEWLAENQGKVIGWGVDIANFFVKGAADAALLIGDLVNMIGPFLDLIKVAVVGTFDAIKAVMDPVFSAMSHLPGGQIFADAKKAMDDVAPIMDKIGSYDIGLHSREFNLEMQKLGNVTLPKIADQITDIGGKIADNSDIGAAFTEKEADGEVKDDAFSIVKDASGNASKDPEHPMLRLAGDQEQWDLVTAKMLKLGDVLKVNSAGVITSMNSTSDKAKDAWEEWFKAQTADPKTVPVKLQGIDPMTGQPVKNSGDLVPPGSTTVGVTGGNDPATGTPRDDSDLTPKSPSPPGGAGYTGSAAPSYTTGVSASGSPSGGPPSQSLTEALQRAGIDQSMFPLIAGFSATEGNNGTGVPTLGFTDSQAGSTLDEHAAALAKQLVDRLPVAGPFPGANASPADQAAWMATVVGQNGSPSDWQGNAQPARSDYVGRIVNAMPSAAPGTPNVAAPTIPIAPTVGTGPLPGPSPETFSPVVPVTPTAPAPAPAAPAPAAAPAPSPETFSPVVPVVPNANSVAPTIPGAAPGTVDLVAIANAAAAGTPPPAAAVPAPAPGAPIPDDKFDPVTATAPDGFYWYQNPDDKSWTMRPSKEAEKKPEEEKKPESAPAAGEPNPAAPTIPAAPTAAVPTPTTPPPSGGLAGLMAPAAVVASVTAGVAVGLSWVKPAEGMTAAENVAIRLDTITNPADRKMAEDAIYRMATTGHNAYDEAILARTLLTPEAEAAVQAASANLKMGSVSGVGRTLPDDWWETAKAGRTASGEIGNLARGAGSGAMDFASSAGEMALKAGSKTLGAASVIAPFLVETVMPSAHTATDDVNTWPDGTLKTVTGPKKPGSTAPTYYTPPNYDSGAGHDGASQREHRGLPAKKTPLDEFLAQTYGYTPGFTEGGSTHGMIPGYGGGDTVPILAEPGEFIVNKVDAAANKDLLHAVNSGVRGYQTGGPVVDPKIDPTGAQTDTIAVAEALSKAFPSIVSIGLYRGPDGYNEHSSGEAADVSPGGIGTPAEGQALALGDQINATTLANAAAFGVEYTIWQNKMWYPDGHSEPYGHDPSNTTDAHMDHVHIRTQGGGFPTGGGPGAGGNQMPHTGTTSSTPTAAAAAMLTGQSFNMPASSADSFGSSTSSSSSSSSSSNYALSGSPQNMEWQKKQQDNQDSIRSTGAALAKAQSDLAADTAAQSADYADWSKKKAAWDAMTEEQRNVDTTAAAELKKSASKLSTSNDKLAADNETLSRAQTSARDAVQQAQIDSTPKTQGNNDAQALGAGLVKGIFQELGFPDVFGKDPSQWGITKLLMGGAGYGLGLMQNMTRFPGLGSLPGSPGDAGGSGPAGGSGLVSILQGLTTGAAGPQASNLLFQPPGGPPSNVANAMAPSQTPADGGPANFQVQQGPVFNTTNQGVMTPETAQAVSGGQQVAASRYVPPPAHP